MNTKCLEISVMINFVSKRKGKTAVSKGTSSECLNKKQKCKQGTWVAQSIKRPALDFGSSHDLTVHEIKSHIRFCDDSMAPTWDSLSLSLSAPPPPMCSLLLSQTLKKCKQNIKFLFTTRLWMSKYF